MNEKKVLDGIRKYTLWAVLGSAALLLVLELLKAWDVIKTTSDGASVSLGADAQNALGSLLGGSLDGLGQMMSFSAPSVNAWGHIEETLGIIVAIGALVLLALLVSSRTKLGKADDGVAKSAPARVATASAVAPVAKAPAARAAAAKPKK